MSNNLHKKDVKPASVRRGRTAVVKVDKLVREIRNLAVSCINFVSALSTQAVELGLRTKRHRHSESQTQTKVLATGFKSTKAFLCYCTDQCRIAAHYSRSGGDLEKVQ